MGFRSKLNFKYSTTHENRIWNRLVESLEDVWFHKKETAYLIGNYMAEGHELDALFIKHDAIVVIDFKDYGGKLFVSENEPWTADGVVINSSRKNPYKQLSDNKYAVLNLLDKKLPADYKSWINLGHINALALFHQKIAYDVSDLKNDLSQPVSRWFHICDFEHVMQSLDEITSRETSIRGERVDILLDALNLSGLVDASSDFGGGSEISYSHEKPQHDGSSIDKSLNLSREYKEDSLSFADIYYDKAKEIENINLLIVGQDPYPLNPNGVAFCKNSYYELYQEDCSGGIVLSALGISKEEARKINRKNPKNLFYDLLVGCGICFVNVFNKPYDQIPLEQVAMEAKRARDFNLPLVKKSKTIVLLGKKRTRNTFDEFYQPYTYHHVLIHPSIKAKKENENEWAETWTKTSLSHLWV